MVHKVLKKAAGGHKKTVAAHAAGKRGNAPLVGKRHEDMHARSRTGGHVHHAPKRTAAG